VQFVIAPSQLTYSNAINTLLNEKIYNQPQYSTLTNKALIHILLFGHPELLFLNQQ